MSQIDYEKHMNGVNDLMKNYLKNVTNQLEGLNVGVDKENKVLEKVSEDDVKVMREKSPLRVFVNGTPKKNGNANKSNPSSSTKKKTNKN